jgi:thermostable 8-oxoguanine DNA glycosylase
MTPNKKEILNLIEKYNQDTGYAQEEDNIFNETGKNIQKRGYAKKEEFIEIVRWKAVRAIRKAEVNDEKVIEKITKFAFEINNEEVKMRVLTSLSGVSIPMASAILTIAYPAEYGIIDIRAWETLYVWSLVKYSKKTFNLKDWLLYLRILRDLSKKYNLPPREIDKALFMYDKLNREGILYKKGK